MEMIQAGKKWMIAATFLWTLPAVANRVVVSDRVVIDREPGDRDQPSQPTFPQVERELCIKAAKGHAITMPGIAKDFIIERGDAQFIELDSGHGFLTGIAYSRSKPNKRIEFDIFLSAREGHLSDDEWYFYHHIDGYIRGFDGAAGLNVELSRKGGPFQIGYGANQKNDRYGAAAWFNYEGSRKGSGDINIELVSCEEPPPPPAKPRWMNVEVLTSNGTGCPEQNAVKAQNSNTVDFIDLPKKKRKRQTSTIWQRQASPR